MSTFNQAANFNGQVPRIDPSQAAMLLIDQQSGLFQTVVDHHRLRSAASQRPADPRVPRSRATRPVRRVFSH